MIDLFEKEKAELKAEIERLRKKKNNRRDAEAQRHNYSLSGFAPPR
ncbi:MAG: hypothetical protein IPJ81_17075 [Chitinophagaceae bacterium]|nr:hypothetical protein [Chitinophagaceae bacterium]